MELEQAFGTELDLPPEYCHYKDEGCELAESCLNCPFPGCIYDEHGGKQRLLKRQRDAEIVRLFKKEAKGVKAAARVNEGTEECSCNYPVAIKEPGFF